MLKDRNQNRITVIISKIDLVSLEPRKRSEISCRIIELCTNHQFDPPTILFVSSTTGEGIEELKNHLNDLAKASTRNLFIPKLFAEFEKRLKDCNSLKSIISCDELKLSLFQDVAKTIDNFDMIWNGFIDYQQKLGSIVVSKNKKLLCTDPSRYDQPTSFHLC